MIYYPHGSMSYGWRPPGVVALGQYAPYGGGAPYAGPYAGPYPNGYGQPAAYGNGYNYLQPYNGYSQPAAYGNGYAPGYSNGYSYTQPAAADGAQPPPINSPGLTPQERAWANQMWQPGPAPTMPSPVWGWLGWLAIPLLLYGAYKIDRSRGFWGGTPQRKRRKR